VTLRYGKLFVNLRKLTFAAMSHRNALSFFLFAAFLVGLYACSGSRAYYKKAEALRQAGLEDEAAEFYYESVRRNPSNVDARIALKSAGQKMLDKKLEKFYKAHGAGNYGEAVYAWRDAKAYKDKVSSYVQLEQAPYYESYYRESKDKYLSTRYTEANKLMEEERFEQANDILLEILKIDPHYENAKRLQRTSNAEPQYRSANESYEAGNYRNAYLQFKSVVAIDPNYKDAARMLSESLNKARLTIAIMPVEAGTGIDKAVADKFYDILIAELLKSENPLITVIDRRNTQQILEEQRLALSGVVEQGSAAQAGKLLGARVVLTAKILSLSEQEQKPSLQRQRGWEEYKERRYNKATDTYYNQTLYRKVQYDVYSGRSAVQLSISGAMISSETGAVLSGNTLTKSAEDVLQFAAYQGNVNMLHPGNWASLQRNMPDDKIITSGPEKRALQQMLREKRRTLQAIADLRISAMQAVGKEIADALNQYEQSRP
jgi:tetratricopeptide (TPR) repeat protein